MQCQKHPFRSRGLPAGPVFEKKGAQDRSLGVWKKYTWVHGPPGGLTIVETAPQKNVDRLQIQCVANIGGFMAVGHILGRLLNNTRAKGAHTRGSKGSGTMVGLLVV